MTVKCQVCDRVLFMTADPRLEAVRELSRAIRSFELKELSTEHEHLVRRAGYQNTVEFYSFGTAVFNRQKNTSIDAFRNALAYRTEKGLTLGQRRDAYRAVHPMSERTLIRRESAGAELFIRYLDAEIRIARDAQHQRFMGRSSLVDRVRALEDEMARIRELLRQAGITDE